MEWILWAYPLLGLPVGLWAGRNISDDQKGKSGVSTSEIAWLSLAYAAFWPVTTPVLGFQTALKHDKRKAEAVKREAMTLETAYEVIAKHEAKLQKERHERNERLRRDWTRLSGLEVGLDKPSLSERPYWRYQESSIASIWASVHAAEEDARRAERAAGRAMGYKKRKY